MAPTDLRQRVPNGAAAAQSRDSDSPTTTAAQATAADLADLPTLLDPVTCVRKGLCPVTQLRHAEPTESHALYYEQHGDGPEHIVLIMGLNGSFLGWIYQVEYLARVVDQEGKSRYSVLVFDNRGAGNSGTPRGPYSTSAMAEDVIALLDYVDWTENRGVHIVGISLGGMIAQEIAWRVSERIASLVLAVTTAGGPVWSNFPPWFGTFTLTRLLFTSDRSKKVPVIVDMLFEKEWLDKLAEDDPTGRTNRQVQCEEFLRRMNATRSQQPLGALSQMWAGLTHSVNHKRLETIAASVPYIALATGDKDHLVEPQHTEDLARWIPGVDVVRWPGTGHAVQIQRVREFCELIEKAVEEGRKRSLEENPTAARE